MDLVKATATRLSAGTGAQIDGWSKERVWRVMKRYFASNDATYRALRQLEPPDPALIERCRKRKGEPAMHGGQYGQDGFYCPNCDGILGTDEQEATRNGWRCYVRPEEHNIDNAFGL